MSRLVVLGSGTVIPEGDRGGSCHYVEMGDVRALLDCGPGAVQALARHGVPWPNLTHLVLTHFHGDHVGALPGLFFALKHGIHPGPRDRPLEVLGPPGTRDLFRGLAEALGAYLLDPGFPVEIREGAPGRDVELGARVRLSTRGTPHTDESRALRLDGPGTSVGYTGDTGRDPGLGDFMEGVEILLCECSLTDDEVGENHLSPSGVAEIASRARPDLLLLTHVYPHVRRAHDVPALVAAAGWEGRTELAADGDVHPLGA
jgi:ribonuclease BN (tRNA processing enzyme)